MEGRTHRPVHDEARCAACSICVALCPAVRFPEYRADAGTVRAAVHGAGALVPVRDEVRPCSAACPLHQDVPHYVAAAAHGDPAAALEVIRATNPLPAVCGTVCNRSCERACVRARVDQGVQIRAIKRFAVEAGVREQQGPPGGVRVPDEAARAVAVVGSGPAGLAAAHDLAAAGLRVSVFEEQPRIGGLLGSGIPGFVLPRALLAADLRAIEALGVEFHAGVRIGRDVSLAALRRDHDVVLLAVGAVRGRPLGLPGERWLEDVVDHVSFARRVSIEGPQPRSGPAVVVGGSVAALECARIALRLGCRPVTVAFARALDRFPADAEALEDAAEEGVRLLGLARPIEVLAEAGRLTGVRLERLREEEPDAWGYRPLAVSGEAPINLRVGTLVVALDRTPDLRLLGGMPGLSRTPLGFLGVDPATGMTAVPGLFAAGDVVSGPKGVVEAVAAGRKAARGILGWLQAGPEDGRKEPACVATAAPPPTGTRQATVAPAPTSTKPAGAAEARGAKRRRAEPAPPPERRRSPATTKRRRKK